MKKFYEAPSLQLITIASADIITASLINMDGEADTFDTGIAEISIT